MARLTLVLAAALVGRAGLAALPAAGPASPAAEAYDQVIGALMQQHGVPGGAIAVARHGRLVVARGYGVADPAKPAAPLPTSLWRIASVSKPITSVAVFHLVEQGHLTLDQPVLPLLRPLVPAGGPADPRWAQITVRHLLQHTGGFDRDKSLDPMFVPEQAAEAVNAAAPADAATVVRYMMGLPLDFDPGARHAYSNFGYCVLGRVIEAVIHQTYIDYVRAQVLKPMGIRGMRQARTRAADRQPGEVVYTMPPETEPVPSVFPNVKGLVPVPYGGFHIEAMDAHGGWLASPVDLARFLVRLEGGGKGFLTSASLATMTARPAPPLPQNEAAFYACGWMVRPWGKSANWWHAGALPGTATILVRTADGYVWAALFNAWPSSFLGELDSAMWQARLLVDRQSGGRQWPEGDLFDTVEPRP